MEGELLNLLEFFVGTGLVIFVLDKVIQAWTTLTHRINISAKHCLCSLIKQENPMKVGISI